MVSLFREVINSWKRAALLRSTLKYLKEHNALPVNIEVGQVGKYFFASVFDESIDGLMHERAAGGAGLSPQTAVLKALSEHVERKAFLALQHKGNQTLEHGTDGFAAFPVFKIQRNEAHKNAREKAFFEALERFAWASWWDQMDFGFNATEPQFHCGLVDEIHSLVKIHQLFVLELKHSSQNMHQVILLFAQLQGGGFISAGAAGYVHSRAETELRAISELYRHGAAVVRYRRGGLLPRNRYEERLITFASGQYDDVVLKRLGSSGVRTLPIPILAIDEEVVHPWSERIVVWRCLFAGQPQFLGGDLTRFCI